MKVAEAIGKAIGITIVVVLFALLLILFAHVIVWAVHG